MQAELTVGGERATSAPGGQSDHPGPRRPTARPEERSDSGSLRMWERRFTRPQSDQKAAQPPCSPPSPSRPHQNQQSARFSACPVLRGERAGLRSHQDTEDRGVCGVTCGRPGTREGGGQCALLRSPHQLVCYPVSREPDTRSARSGSAASPTPGLGDVVFGKQWTAKKK